MFDNKLLDQLLKLQIGVSQDDNLILFEILNDYYPITIHKYKSGREHNGWVIPYPYHLKKATISQDGRILFDGLIHPLAVIGSPVSFHGVVDKKELDKHVFFRPDLPDSYAFHCTNNYRPWNREWGFSIPYQIYKGWNNGNYEVDLEVEYSDGEMLVGELFHQGELEDTLVFNAHTCHPCQANDDMIGVLAIIELFRALKGKKTRFSYLGILAPEHLGTVFYLADKEPGGTEKIKLGCFVEMIGTKTPLVLQKTFFGDTLFDKLAEGVLSRYEKDLRVGEFRSIVGNDETVWESPGIEIPMISVSRWPYKEYHTDADNTALMDPVVFDETVYVLLDLIAVIENNSLIQRRFTGLVALSNPKYGLYIEREDPTIKKEINEEMRKLGKLQDFLPRFFDTNYSVFEIAQQFNLSFDTILAYIKRFEEKDLVLLTPVSELSYYHKRVNL